MEFKKNIISTIEFYTIACLAFTLPLFPKLLPILIALLIIVWLLKGNFKEKFQAIINNRFAFLFISLYLLSIIGLLYTSNMKSGLFELEQKLSILLFPILFSNINAVISSEKKLKNILVSFILGCFIASLFCLANAFYVYLKTQENHFLYTIFSFLLHPSYFAMYLDFAVAMIIYSLIIKREELSKLLRYTMFFLLFFFSGIIILLSSKMGIIVLLLIYAATTLYLIIVMKKYFAAILLLLYIATATIGTIKYVPSAYIRLKLAAIAAFTNEPLEKMDGTRVRIETWKTSLDIISNNFFTGVGTGDVKDVLIKKYEENNIPMALVYKLNSHNQFLQTTIAFGILGFLSLMASLFIPLIKSYKEKNYIYTFFLVIIILNFLVESMLETQAGVIFYAFFNSLLLFGNDSTDEK